MQTILKTRRAVDTDVVKTLYHQFLAIHTLKYCQENKERCANFNSLFQAEFNTKMNLLDLIKNILYNVEAVKVADTEYKIFIDGNAKINNLKVDTLIKLIDDGNLRIRGLNLFNQSFDLAKLDIKRFM